MSSLTLSGDVSIAISGDYCGTEDATSGEYDNTIKSEENAYKGKVVFGSNGNDWIGPVNSVTEGKETLVGGNGADYLQMGKLMFAGSMTTKGGNGIYAESEDAITSGGLTPAAASDAYGIGGTYSDATKALETNHNVMNPYGVNNAEMVFSNVADTLFLYVEKRGSDGNKVVNQDVGKTYSIHRFTVGKDAILGVSTYQDDAGSEGLTTADLAASVIGKGLTWTGETGDSTSGTLKIDWLKMTADGDSAATVWGWTSSGQDTTTIELLGVDGLGEVDTTSGADLAQAFFGVEAGA